MHALMNSHFVLSLCVVSYTWCIVMSGTSAFPIVLDTDSEVEDANEKVEEIEELTLKDSPLKLICTKRHR